MADDIQVRFGGDASGIRAAAQQAKAAVQDQAAAAQAANATTAQALRDLGAEMRATREAMQAQVAAAQQTAAATARIAAATRQASDWQTDLKAALERTTLGYLAVKAAAWEAAATMAVWNAAVSIDRSAAGSWGALPGQIREAAVAARDYYTSVAYAEHGGRLFAQANEGVRASIGRMILDVEQFVDRMRASSAEMVRNQVVAISAAEGLERFRTALGLTDSGAKDVLLRFTAELQKIPGLSREAAAGIEVMLATVPNYSVDTNMILVNLLQTISKTGDEAVANAQKIGSAFRDQQNGGRILGDLTADLRNLEDIQVLARRIAASLTPQQAISYFDTIEGRLKKQAEQQAFIAEENDKAIRRYPLIGNALADINERLYGAQAAQRSLNDEIRVATLELRNQRREREGIVAAQQREADTQKAINFEASQAGRLQQSETASTLLRGRLGNAEAASRMTPAERDLMIRTVYGEAGGEGAEGQEAVANVIRNRVLSGRYGGSYQDVITAPRQFSVWNPGDPAGTRARGLSPDSETYRRTGEIVDKVYLTEAADPTKGATNYYNPKAADPAWGRTLGNVTDIGNHRFGNTPESPPVGDAAQQDAIRQRLEEQADLRRRIADEQRGGTQADVASLAIAQENLTAARDAVAEAQRLVEARRHEVEAARAGTPASRLAAARSLAEAEQTLRDRQRAQEQSETDLRVAGMETSSAERVRIVNEEVTKQQAAYHRGSAEWNRLELQKTNNLRAKEKAAAQEAEAMLRARTALKTVGSDNSDSDTARVRIAMLDQLLAKEEVGSLKSIQLAREKAEIETALERASAAEKATAEDTAYQNARRVLDDRIKDIRAEAGERQLSFEERRSQTLAVLTEIEALERGHQERLKQIWGDGTSQYRQAKAQLLQLDGQSAARRAQAEREVNKAVYQDTRRSYEQIGATLTSNAFAVLQGQQTVAQAAKSTAMSIVQSYVQAKVRLAADWLAGVTTHQAGEAAKTAATVAGVTTRTSAEEAGAATSLATQTGAMIKSIMASAAETFAGIFGFLSPLMGPAAVGPAVAGQATVAAAAAAIPSFAVGAWSLPGDTLANVHRGEMIVPAAATPWAQSLMAQAAGGGAGAASAGGGDVHFHVSAMDAAGVRSFFRANARHIMEAINDGVRTGSHLGLSKLRS
ncbi:cell wall hydrolase [Methylobacterium sp. EM32]|uniref:cell wall hydrolase n=1 Tax=Methylobacterium sp. EM32 TaxID=3163481 RepID=UPI0033A5F3EC